MADNRPDLSKLRIERAPASGGGRGGWVVAVLVSLLFGGYAGWREGWIPQQWLPGAMRGADQRPLVTTGRVARTGGAPQVPRSGTSSNGYVVARRRAELSTDIQGRITAIFVEEGDRVEEGQLIAQLDTRQLEAGLANARALLAQRQAALRDARLDFERFEKLVATGDARVSELDDARAVLDGEVAAADALVAQIEEIEVMIDKSSVYAPFAGMITAKNAEVGEVVASLGATTGGAVATLVDFETLEVQVELAQTSLSSVHEGAPATIYLDAWPTDGYRGRVRQIWPTANRQKATVEVRVEFLERDDRILPEMGVRTVFDAPDAPGPGAVVAQVRVPTRALVGSGDARAVLLVVDGVLERRPVTLGGEPVDGAAVVTEGLVGGETVVLDPDPALVEGMSVRLPATGQDRG